MVYKCQNKLDFEEQLKKAGDKLVVIDFFATWCGPCNRIAPFYEELSQKHKDKAVFLKVDVDEIEELIGEYNIGCMPTFILKRNGQHLDTLAGSNEEKLRELIEKHIN